MSAKSIGFTSFAAFTAALLAGAASAQTTGVDTDNDPAHINVRSLQTAAIPGAVVLKSGTTSEVMGALPVMRRLSMQQILANPRIKLDQTELDLTPMISRKGSLVLVSKQINAAPSIARVVANDFEVTEVQQGLVIRSFINYQLAPGVCADNRRGQVESIGLHCATHLSDQAREQSFSDPADVHYVADPRRRAAAVSRAKAAAATQREEITKYIATLRQQLKEPPRAIPGAPQLVVGDHARLAALSDDDLRQEMANRAETKIEQVSFIPRNIYMVNLKKPVAVSLPQKPKPVTSDTPLEPAPLLAGFTLGSDYEWKERIETSISWCIIGCTRHYYAEVYAGFSYGFGLRFPIKVTGAYHYTNANGGQAQVTTHFAPFDGGPGDYLATGLPSSKVFNGQEFVAQAEVHAGFSAHIPIYPDPPSLDFKLGTDFAAQLPAPFSHGNFTPPAAHQDSAQAPIFFESVDMLGGMLDFGFAGAKVLPGVEVGLHSNSLTLELQDKKNGKTTLLDHDGQVVPVSVDQQQESNFTIGNPVYDLSFIVTPGIDARLFIDIDVWSHKWDFPIWLSALRISLPPGGLKFTCHEGTLCAHNYAFLSQNGSTLSSPKDIANKQITDWFKSIDAKWKSQCLNELCRQKVAIMAGQVSMFATDKAQHTNWGDPASAQAMMDALVVFEAAAEKNIQQDFAKWHGKDLDGSEK